MTTLLARLKLDKVQPAYKTYYDWFESTKEFSFVAENGVDYPLCEGFHPLKYKHGWIVRIQNPDGKSGWILADTILFDD